MGDFVEKNRARRWLTDAMDRDIALKLAESDLARWTSRREKLSVPGAGHPLVPQLIVPMNKCNWKPLHVKVTDKEIRFYVKFHLTYEGKKGDSARRKAKEDIPKIKKELRDRWSTHIPQGIYAGRRFHLEPIIEYHEWGSPRNLDYWQINVRKTPKGDSKTDPTHDGGTMSLNPDDVKSGWLVAAHELAHLFNLPDQYRLAKHVPKKGKAYSTLPYASRYDTQTSQAQETRRLANQYGHSPDHADLLGFLWPDDPNIHMDREQRILQKKDPKPFLEDIYFLFYLHNVPQVEYFYRTQKLYRKTGSFRLLDTHRLRDLTGSSSQKQGQISPVFQRRIQGSRQTQFPKTQFPKTQFPKTQFPKTQFPKTKFPKIQGPIKWEPGKTKFPKIQGPIKWEPGKTKFPKIQGPIKWEPGKTQFPITQGPTSQLSLSNVHVVKRGETLSRIARNHGTTVNQLAKLNPWLLERRGRILRGVDYIVPGDPIGLPSHRTISGSNTLNQLSKRLMNHTARRAKPFGR